MQNASFWIWENGAPVRLTLRAGQQLRWGRFGYHDEGWAMRTRHWRFDADDQRVYEMQASDGTDCDGRFAEQVLFCCVVTRPGGGVPDEDHASVVYPAWERVSASQRDYFAEAMGY